MVAGCETLVVAGGARVATPEGCDGKVAAVGEVIVVGLRAVLVSGRTAPLGAADVSGCGGSDPASKGRGSRIGEVGTGVDATAVVGLMLGPAKRPSSTGRDVVGGWEATVPYEVVDRGADAAAGGVVIVVVVERSGLAEVDAAVVDVGAEVAPVVKGGGALEADGCRGIDEVVGGA
jgi:hypothetical protein